MFRWEHGGMKVEESNRKQTGLDNDCVVFQYLEILRLKLFSFDVCDTQSHDTYVHKLKSCTNTNSHLIRLQVHTKHQTDTHLMERTQYSAAGAILGSFQAAMNTVYNLRDKTAKWEEHLNDYTFILHFLLSATHTHTHIHNHQLDAGGGSQRGCFYLRLPWRTPDPWGWKREKKGTEKLISAVLAQSVMYVGMTGRNLGHSYIHCSESCHKTKPTDSNECWLWPLKIMHL